MPFRAGSCRPGGCLSNFLRRLGLRSRHSRRSLAVGCARVAGFAEGKKVLVVGDDRQVSQARPFYPSQTFSGSARITSVNFRTGDRLNPARRSMISRA